MDRANRLAADAAASRRNIAVLYFGDQSPDQRLASVADGITEDLIPALQSVQGLSVVSKAGSAAIRGLAIPHDSIARSLRVGTLVTGVVGLDRDSIRVTVRTLDDAGIEMDRATFKRPARDMIGLSERLAEEVATLVRRRVGTTVQSARVRSGTRSSEAWFRYQRAVQARDRGDSLWYSRAVAESRAAYLDADSIAAAAEVLDPNWAEPKLLRAVIAYWRSRRAGSDTALARTTLDSASLHVGRALALRPNHPRGLEVRGELRYFRWLTSPGGDTAQRNRLLRDAQADVESAVRLNPSLASAYATLSHMYNNVAGKTLADVRMAATKALETDAFLFNADVIIGRITLAGYDEGQFSETDRWCREGSRRFPLNPRFVRCRLYVMGMPEAPVDVDLAWQLADSLERLTPDENDRRGTREFAPVLVSAVIARAGLRDSARAVLSRTNPALVTSMVGSYHMFAAYAFMLLGDKEAAIAHLERDFAQSPPSRGDLVVDWRFRAIADDPRYKAMYGQQPR